MINVFLICPVRNATEEQKEKMAQYISDLESVDKKVYYPARDTNQVDSIGYRICCDNKNAIKEADEIHIFYDPNSSGSLFDLGMAFALDKKLTLVNIDDIPSTPTKSFSNMIKEWSKNSNNNTKKKEECEHKWRT
jgi:nucleoside 2-deoxyribosyltransferase